MNGNKGNKKQKGQGLVEYALILVLVAVVVVATLSLAGPIIGNVFSKANRNLVSVGGGGGGAVDGSWTYRGWFDEKMCTKGPETNPGFSFSWTTYKDVTGCYSKEN